MRTLWNWIYGYAIYEIIWICKLYNLHTIMNLHIYEFMYAHVQCIQVYELIKKL